MLDFSMIEWMFIGMCAIGCGLIALGIVQSFEHIDGVNEPDVYGGSSSSKYSKEDEEAIVEYMLLLSSALRRK